MKRGSTALVLGGPMGARLSLTALGADTSVLNRDLYIRRVAEHARQHLHRPLPLGRAAEIAGLERTYFSEYFHRKVGITYVRWLNALRVSTAIDLLLRSDLPIADVAQRTGYHDARTLQRNFKRLTGRTPTAFRRSVAGPASADQGPSAPAPGPVRAAERPAQRPVATANDDEQTLPFLQRR